MPASDAAFQVPSEIGARQTVDEKVDTVVAEEDGPRDIDPATGPVRRGRVVGQLEQISLDDGCTLQELDVVGTPGHEKRNVEDNERGGDQLELPEDHKDFPEVANPNRKCQTRMTLL